MKSNGESSSSTLHSTLEVLVPYEGPQIMESTGPHERRAIPDFGDCIVTGDDGSVTIELKGKGRVTLEPRSHVCVLDAEPRALILVAGRVSGLFDDPDELEGRLTLAMNHGSLVLGPGSEALVAQDSAFERPRANETARLQSHAYFALLRGTALWSARESLQSDEKYAGIQGPCAMGFGLSVDGPAPQTLEEARRAEDAASHQKAPSLPVEPVDVELEKSFRAVEANDKRAREVFTPAGARTDPDRYRQAFEDHAQQTFWQRIRVSLALTMSVAEVLSRCAARAEREADCAALAAWRQKYMSRVHASFVVEQRGQRPSSLQK